MARSKRKSSDETSNKGTKRRKEEDDGILHDHSVFGELVSKAGFVLKSGDQPNELNCDQTMFQRDLELAIKRHPSFPQIVEEFTDALSTHLQDSKRLLRDLMPTVTAAACESSARSGNQESLLRLLLGIDQIQPSIMNMLLEKLAEFTEGEEPVIHANEEVNMPRLILNQFRWLNTIVNSKEVTEKMLEIVCVVSLETQREIITCIPEVVDDSEHNNVAGELKTLLTENSQLAVPILDVLSNLTLKQELLTEVRGSVISTLDSVSVEDLPVIVRFLLQTVTAAEAVEVISEFRHHLDFQSNFSAPMPSNLNGESSKKQNKSASSERSSEALILDSIRSGIRFQRCIADAWVKAIEGVKSAADHRVIDVFVVLILHSCGHKKTVEGLVRGKVRAGHFTEMLLRDAFGSHTQVLREYFPAVLALSEVLLRSPEPVISFFAAAMYQHAFLSFDTYCQQEIVGSLVTHIGSGLLGEVDASLDIMAELVQRHTKKIAPFGIFVKGVLDYLDNLSMGQIRKLYGMLSTLSFHSLQGESQIQDELYIIIRKQLSNTDCKYKKMGVIGAIMVVQSVCTSPDHSDSSDSLADDVLKQVVGLLNLVRASTASSPAAVALFMDELSTMVSTCKLDQKVETWIYDNVMADFQDDFVIDLAPESLEQEALLSMEPIYGLDSGNEGAIGINMLPIISKAIRNETPPDEKMISAVCLSPEFRLLQTCERKQHDDNLEEVDALLGCPVYLPKLELGDKMGSMSKTEKQVMCDSLFFTINWFRELVNAFASQIDPEVKAKVIMRLQNITDLQNLLPKYLAGTSGYSPMEASFDGESGKQSLPAPGQSEGSKKGRKPKKGKKKDADKTMADGDTTALQETQQVTQPDPTSSTQAAEKAVDGRPGVRLAAYRPYLREFDLDVFLILQAGLLTQTSLDTEMNVKDTTQIQLQPPQLELLLDDLVQKLEHILVASSSTRRSFFKSKSRQNAGFSHLDQLGALAVVKRVIKMMPALCDHLEATSAFFQALVAGNDGMLDGPGSNTPEAQQVASCFQLLLVIVNSVCSWAGFAVPEHRDLIKEMLSTLSVRLNTAASTQSSVAELVTQGFQYIENFSSTVPNLSTAVTLTRVLVSLSGRGETEVLRPKIAELAVSFLKREWRGPDGEPLKGAQHNEMLQDLLKTYLSNVVDPLSALEDLATVGFAELARSEKHCGSEAYPTLTKNTFHVFYRVMLAKLVECSKSIPAYSQNDTDQKKLDKLLQWSLAVRIFHIHVNLIKVFEGRSNLNSIIKHGRQFVEVFLRLGMPLLDHTFRHHREDVSSLLKNLQLSTRALHHVAGHSKIVADVSLTNLVPLLKKALESFVYRVKAMLTYNRCLEAFWLGNLKNRDLHGEEILTQSAADTTQESDSESDGLPDDDSSEEGQDRTEDTTNQANESDSSESYSECY